MALLLFLGVFMCVVWAYYKWAYVGVPCSPFWIFIQHLAGSMPVIGLKLKCDYLQDVVENNGMNGCFSGRTRAWQFEELHRRGNYAECARDCFPTPVFVARETVVQLLVALALTMLLLYLKAHIRFV